jgi:protein-tyrosine-phosphatase
MQEIFPLFHQADVVVMATPVFFYGPTAQIKAPIDRSQTLWARKYVHKLTDPGRKWRKGFLLSVGATKGKNLFEGVELTAKYFFDAIGADYQGSLTYKEIEDLDDIKGHSTALMDVSVKAKNIVKPFIDRKKVLFISKNDACSGQIASAFAQYYAGDKLEVQSGGIEPAEKIDPLMEEVMVEKRIDVAFRKPKSIEKATPSGPPDLIINLGSKTTSPLFPEVPVEEWNTEEPDAKNIDVIRQLRDAIEKKVKNL